MQVLAVAFASDRVHHLILSYSRVYRKSFYITQTEDDELKTCNNLIFLYNKTSKNEMKEKENDGKPTWREA